MRIDPPENDQQDSIRNLSTTRTPIVPHQTNNSTSSNSKQANGRVASARANQNPSASTVASTKVKNEITHLPILILGAQGCGKSSFINAAFANNVQEVSNGFELATKEFQPTTGLVSGKHRFVLVDSPGFDNPSINDKQLAIKLIRFLCCGKAGTPAKMAGAIYIHNQETRLGSGCLKRNLQLIKYLLGNSFLGRLTILLVPRLGERADHKELVRPLLDSKSPFRGLYDLGAHIEVSVLETQPIRHLLSSYTDKYPILMNVQQELCRSGPAPSDDEIDSYLNECAQTRNTTSTVAKPKTTSVGQSHKPSSTQHNTNVIERLQLELTESKKQAEGFSAQLQQHLGQYATLCSQLQIHENLEQSDIVQNLVDLNRRIDDLALSLSQHLVDTYAGVNMATTQQAFQLPELKRLFEHAEGSTSLVQSSAGVGMPLEDFLDVAIRSILCEQLYKRILAPFHPGLLLSEARNGYTSAIYGLIREKEPQATLGRWRTASFAAISRMIGDQELTRLKSQAGFDILHENLMPMLRCLFGPSKNAQPLETHSNDLSELVAQAWDWCVVLKEKVVLLGEYQPTAYRYGRPFDSVLMSEFEPRNGGQPPGRLLSTIGLGLNVLRAQPSGEASDRVVLCKASVVTEGWFERP